MTFLCLGALHRSFGQRNAKVSVFGRCSKGNKKLSYDKKSVFGRKVDSKPSCLETASKHRNKFTKAKGTLSPRTKSLSVEWKYR